MFILMILLIVLLIALVRGGSLLNLLQLPLRWNWIALLALGLQLLIFTPFRDAPLIDSFIPQLHILSMAILIGWIAANYRIAGAALLAAGLLANLAAVTANGGYMAGDPRPAAHNAQSVRYGGESELIANNSIATDDVQLWILTDILAVPPFIPFANVFSIGDVLLMLGGGILIYRGMFRAAKPPEANQSINTDLAQPTAQEEHV